MLALGSPNLVEPRSLDITVFEKLWTEADGQVGDTWAERASTGLEVYRLMVHRKQAAPSDYV